MTWCLGKQERKERKADKERRQEREGSRLRLFGRGLNIADEYVVYAGVQQLYRWHLIQQTYL
jgi:hypothetical protein